MLRVGLESLRSALAKKTNNAFDQLFKAGQTAGASASAARCAASAALDQLASVASYGQPSTACAVAWAWHLT